MNSNYSQLDSSQLNREGSGASTSFSNSSDSKVYPTKRQSPTHTNDTEQTSFSTTFKGGLGPGYFKQVSIGLGSAVLYGATAVSMNFVNKLTLREFPSADVILLLQMVSVVLVIYPLKWAGIVEFPAICRSKAWNLLPVTILYVSNVGFALLSIQFLNIPMYNTLKRLTPMIVLIAKTHMTGKMPPQNIAASVALVVGGCLVAGLGDLSFDLTGYVCAIASCTLQASYLLLVEKTGAEKNVTTAELLCYNAILSLPFLILVLVGTGEAWEAVPNFLEATARIGWAPFVALLSACCCVGMLLNWAMFLCTMHNSALTTTIVGVLKGVVATFLGFFLLGGVKFQVLNVGGIVLNTAGGVWYTVIKFQQRQALWAANGRPNNNGVS